MEGLVDQELVFVIQAYRDTHPEPCAGKVE